MKLHTAYTVPNINLNVIAGTGGKWYEQIDFKENDKIHRNAILMPVLSTSIILSQ